MEKIKMQPTRPEDALLTDAFADFLEKCRAKKMSEKTLNIYAVILFTSSSSGSTSATRIKRLLTSRRTP